MRYCKAGGTIYDEKGREVTHVRMYRACKDCGQELRDEADIFCPKCGHKYTRRLPDKVNVAVVIDLLNANWRGEEIPA